MIKSGIYKITCLITNKFYIGNAFVIKQRWGTHKYYLRHNKHSNQHLQFAWNKYGEVAFKFEVIEYIEDRNILAEREQYWLDFTQCYKKDIGYNKRKLADSNVGYKQSKETIEKRAKTLIGRKRTDEHKLRMSLAATGRKHTEAAKAKMQGRKHTNEAKINMSKTKIGHKYHTVESRRKISLAAMGNKSNAGRKLPKEHIEKSALARRKLGKWPCIDGSRCRCASCKKKKNDDQQYRRLSHVRKNAEFIMLPSEVSFSGV